MCPEGVGAAITVDKLQLIDIHCFVVRWWCCRLSPRRAHCSVVINVTLFAVVATLIHATVKGTRNHCLQEHTDLT